MKFDRIASCIAAQLVLAAASAYLPAQSIVRVEEEWALQVLEPDEQLNSPQITTCMMPFGSNSSKIVYLDINHGSYPDYSPGGLQLRVEQNGQITDSKRILSSVNLNRSSETIKWTQILVQQGNQTRFGIVSGQSQTWSYFGGVETFTQVTSNSTNLDAYRPTDSLANSGVVYAGNRVASLTLLRIRLYNTLGQVAEIAINQSPL
jgi:hypothetical protein